MQRIVKWIMIVAAVAILWSSPLAFERAQAADGDGSGGEQNNPLTIVSSSPADGSIDVKGLEYIKIVFSKNVAYMTVRDGNKKCFSLWSDGQMIPAEIVIADDQIEREKRNDVLVKPLQPLKAGTTYRVEVAPEVQSKSGVTLSNKAIISFTTAGASPAPSVVSPEAQKPAAENALTPTPSAGNPDTPAATITKPEPTSPTSTSSGQNPAASSNPLSSWLWIGLGAAAIILAGWIYHRTGHAKQK